MLADFLLGTYRRQVLALLLLHPERALHVREIARLTQTQPGTLTRELTRLFDAGLLLRNKVGNQLHYSANPACPIFDELTGLLRKTAGVVDVLRDALATVSTNIELALVYGSVARGEERAGSDVDVLVVGELSFVDVVTALHPAQAGLQREINPAVYSIASLREKITAGDRWARELITQPKLFLIGDAGDFGKLVSDSSPDRLGG